MPSRTAKLPTMRGGAPQETAMGWGGAASQASDTRGAMCAASPKPPAKSRRRIEVKACTWSLQ
ncbi:hypothetical protein WME88_29955 [Sorangium sp. So ce216]